ncbi:hypothetical protein DZ858_01580 [Marixanthomonas ophiurae]|uniref:Uncharacterized protein n=1 Tax=Marixanthomonas ophiurae TaxID=387659 RepID=A0A3E1Q9J6_9FLAO|nr:hypothetical protein DZ858_01580 [Marixanthomonas ophiurae]
MFKTNAQQNPIQLLPDFSLGQPIGAFSNETFNTKNGFGGGLHLEKQNLWKVFGLGLYAGYHSYETDFSTLFPNQVNDPNFTSSVLFQGDNLNWKSLQLDIGPTINFNLTQNLQLQGFTKAGIAKVSYPEYRYFVDVSTPTTEQFTLFEANTPNETQSNLNFMMLSGFRFNYKLSNTLGIHIGANYTHINGLIHTYTSRDIQITGDESPSVLYETLQNTPEITKTYECNINTVNGTVGIAITIGGGSNPQVVIEEEPDIPITTNEPKEEYICERVIYEAPGYNDYVVLSETPYAIFEWIDENPRTLKEDKGYQLLFYIKENGEYKEVDKRIMDFKRRFKIGLNPNKPYPDNALYWKIIPVDDNESEFCPEPTKMMRLLVFENANEAKKRLPECLKEDVINKPVDTNFFKKPKSNEKKKN